MCTVDGKRVALGDKKKNGSSENEENYFPLNELCNVLKNVTGIFNLNT